MHSQMQFLGQCNTSHEVLLLTVTQYTNCKVLKKIYSSSIYWNSIARCVIFEYDTTENSIVLKTNTYKFILELSCKLYDFKYH